MLTLRRAISKATPAGTLPPQVEAPTEAPRSVDAFSTRSIPGEEFSLRRRRVQIGLQSGLATALGAGGMLLGAWFIRTSRLDVEEVTGAGIALTAALLGGAGMRRGAFAVHGSDEAIKELLPSAWDCVHPLLIETQAYMHREDWSEARISLEGAYISSPIDLYEAAPEALLVLAGLAELTGNRYAARKWLQEAIACGNGERPRTWECASRSEIKATLENISVVVDRRKSSSPGLYLPKKDDARRAEAQVALAEFDSRSAALEEIARRA